MMWYPRNRHDVLGRKRTLICLSLYLYSLLAVTLAQARPRIAVVPLNYIDVSRAEAAALTELLETALVNTEVFQVLERSDIGAVLEAQERSLADCTDEKCAVEIGKLLAAEQIVLGAVSALGATRVLTASIIDVRTGQKIKADRVDAPSVESLAKQVNLLAFMLAGLTYREGQVQRMATEFGEVFVETAPEEAEIYLNGVRKARSPYLLTKVPAGTVVIEARKGTLYARTELQVSAGKLTRSAVKLEEVFGNLFIASREKDVVVFIDGQRLGPIGSGLVPNLPVGPHSIELKGDGLYWNGDVTITSDKSTTVEATPRVVGTLEYSLLEGVTAEILGIDSRTVVRGEGVLDRLSAGRYEVTASSDIHEVYRAQVVVARGNVTTLRPSLLFTSEHLAELARQERAAAYMTLGGRLLSLQGAWADGDQPISAATLEEVSQLLASAKDRDLADIVTAATDLLRSLQTRKNEQDRLAAYAEYRRSGDTLRDTLDAGARIVEAHLKQAASLLGAVRAAPWGFGDIEAELVLLTARLEHTKSRQDEQDRVSALHSRRGELVMSLRSKGKVRSARAVAGVITIAVGALGIAGGVASFVLADRAYSRYVNATVTSDVEKARQDVLTWDTLSYVGIGVTVSATLSSGILLIFRPSLRAEISELRDVERALEAALGPQR